MIAGRTVLGLGAESMIVAVTTVLAKWFKGKELSFAFGINLTIARLASVAADNSPTWANRAFYPHGPDGRTKLARTVVDSGWCRSTRRALLGNLLGARRAGRKRATNWDRPVPSTSWSSGNFFDLISSYWFVVGLCFTFYSAIFPFRTFAIDFFTNKIWQPTEG